MTMRPVAATGSRTFILRSQSFRDGSFTIGQLSRIAGVNIETIRFYERVKLLPQPPRRPSGHRVYDQDGLRSLIFVKRARELGFGLEDIRALLSLRVSGPCCMDVKAIANRHLETVRARLDSLAKLESALTEIIARCPGDESIDCPVIDILDAADPDASALKRHQI